MDDNERGEIRIPRITVFFGISMYMDDHGVPHCHAMYGDYAGFFRLEDDELMAGQVPPAQANKIKTFIRNHQTELKEKWDELSG